MRALSLLLAVCLVAVPAAFAQTDRGTITGTVSDATGAVIPGASIEAKNVRTGAVYTAGSSETGNFTLPQLPAGTYEVSGLLPRFKKFVRARITLQVGHGARVHAGLEVRDHTETVSREAAA